LVLDEELHTLDGGGSSLGDSSTEEIRYACDKLEYLTPPIKKSIRKAVVAFPLSPPF
jgi:hypothetical protein